MARVVIDLDATELQATLKAIQEELGDLRPLLKRIGNLAIRNVDQKFRREGPGWPPLAESTLKRRRKAGRGAKILRDTGRLHQSIVANGPGGIYKLSQTQLEVGSNLPYAAVHQEGGKRRFAGGPTGRRRGIPARPYIPSAEELTPAVDEFMELHLASLITKRLSGG